MASIAELTVDIGVDAERAIDSADELGSMFGDAAREVDRAGAKIEASFDGVSDAARQVDDAGSTAAGGLDKVGESADVVDTRAMGFRDTITGLQDTFKGLTDDSLSLGDRLFTLGAGLGDLASGVFNLVVPALKQLTLTNIRSAAATAAHRAAMIASTVATKAMTVAQAALNVVMKANPIVKVITLLVALGAAIVVAWKKSETFRNIVTGAWNAVRGAVSAVVGWFTGTAWPTIKRVWESITSGARSMKDGVVGVWRSIKNSIRGAVSSIKSFLSGIWDGIVSGARSAVNSAISVINSAIRGINAVTGAVGIPAIPQIPFLAEGGIVTGPTLAVLGEAGPEAVVPLPAMNRVGGGPMVLHIDSEGSALDDVLVEVLRKSIRARGGLESTFGGER